MKVAKIGSDTEALEFMKENLEMLGSREIAHILKNYPLHGQVLGLYDETRDPWTKINREAIKTTLQSMRKDDVGAAIMGLEVRMSEIAASVYPDKALEIIRAKCPERKPEDIVPCATAVARGIAKSLLSKKDDKERWLLAVVRDFPTSAAAIAEVSPKLKFEILELVPTSAVEIAKIYPETAVEIAKECPSQALAIAEAIATAKKEIFAYYGIKS